MRHEFTADVACVADGEPIETGMPPAIVTAEGLSGSGARFVVRDPYSRGAGEWFGRRVRVTIETIDGKE